MKIKDKLRFSTQTPGVRWRTYIDLTKHHYELPENRAREVVLRALLFGTLAICGLFCSLLIVSYLAGNTHVAARLLVNSIGLLYLICLYLLLRSQKYHLASLLLVCFYVLISSIATWQWGINMPFATLMMSVTITLAGILLGARYSLYTAAAFIAVVLTMQLLTTAEIHLADQSWQTGAPSLFGEAIGYCLLFIVLALVAWLVGRQTERSLKQAREAEAALLKEKKLLAVRLKERTEKLRAAQLKDMQQLYRFAELGQLSTSLLHDLANHLTMLMLDIEDLELRPHTRAIERAKQSMVYLDDLVAKVSRQVRDKGEDKSFNCWHNLQTVGANLRSRFTEAGVILNLTHRGQKQYLQYKGDPVRFSQVMTILITNALEAAAAQPSKGRRRVRVRLLANKLTVEIQVSDWGNGISPDNQYKLFKSFYSTKEDGMGIGLFITKQIIETHFKGSVLLDNNQRPTTFKVTFPHRSPYEDSNSGEPHQNKSRPHTRRPTTGHP